MYGTPWVQETEAQLLTKVHELLYREGRGVEARVKVEHFGQTRHRRGGGWESDWKQAHVGYIFLVRGGFGCWLRLPVAFAVSLSSTTLFATFRPALYYCWIAVRGKKKIKRLPVSFRSPSLLSRSLYPSHSLRRTLTALSLSSKQGGGAEVLWLAGGVRRRAATTAGNVLKNSKTLAVCAQ